MNKAINLAKDVAMFTNNTTLRGRGKESDYSYMQDQILRSNKNADELDRELASKVSSGSISVAEADELQKSINFVRTVGHRK